MNFHNMASAIRMLSIDAVSRAKSGHPGMPVGMADVATVLFSHFLKFNSHDPDWPDRDRFVLSAGHGSMLLYSLLYLTGYRDITIEEIKNFRTLHSKTAGHPEYGLAKGIENTSGPLGQGFANAVGMAIAERMLSSRFGTELVNHYTYVIAGDGCLMEGISHEAASLAGHLGLGKLILLFDDNNISIDGSTSLAVSDDHMKRFEAYGWHTNTIDGHNYDEIHKAIAQARSEQNKPSIISCRTIIGKFIPNKAGTSAAHSWPMTEEEMQNTRKNLRWKYDPFIIPDDLLKTWRSLSNQEKKYEQWNNSVTDEFLDYIKCKLPKDYEQLFAAIKQEVCTRSPTEATRKSSGGVLDVITKHIPQLVGGSADLSGSNCTKSKSMRAINKEDYSGAYIHYGVREHAMVACMNGMALYGGIIPYAGTFFVFTDYCRPAIRLSALMRQRVIYIMTHDSIGLGEDGPTHQPIEHLAALRAMMNLYVFRPADAIEVTESFQIALQKDHSPSMMVLSRQAVPTIRTQYETNMTVYGAYIISEYKNTFQISIFSTGSEVEIALQAKVTLEERGIGVRVISMPCMELFDEQDTEYKNNLLRNDSLKVAIEAASGFGWNKYIGIDGVFIGLNSFGASAPAGNLYEHFKITPDHLIEVCLEKIQCLPEC